MPILETYFSSFQEAVLKGFSPEQIEHERHIFFSGALAVYRAIMSSPADQTSMENIMRDIGTSVSTFRAEMTMKAAIEELLEKGNPND